MEQPLEFIAQRKLTGCLDQYVHANLFMVSSNHQGHGLVVLTLLFNNLACFEVKSSLNVLQIFFIKSSDHKGIIHLKRHHIDHFQTKDLGKLKYFQH